MKRYLTVLCMALALLLCGMTASTASATSLTQPLRVNSVDIYLNSVLVVTPDSEVYEICQISGPDGSAEWDGTCSEALPRLSARLREEHPLVAFNYIINGYALGTI